MAVARKREFDPSPHDRIVTVANRQPVVHPPETLPLDLLVAIAGLYPAAGVNELVVQALVDQLVGTGLTDEQDVRAEVQDRSAQGLAAVQVFVELDRPIRAKLVHVGGQPTLGGVALALLHALLLGELGLVRRRVLLQLDECRQVRQNALVAVGDDFPREHCMEVPLGPILADFADRALRTVDSV